MAAASSSISAPERKFIANGIEQNIRNDGRERLDFRAFTAECGVIPQANGSCRLRIESTDVLVGVKLDLAEPDPQTPNAGRVVVTVECSPSASQDFEGRGADALNAALSSGLERVLLDSRSLRLEELSVIPGRQCWVLHVDALVIDSDGSLLDALALATRAALKTTAVPSVSVVTGDDGEQEIEVSDNPFDSKALACADDVPVTVSLTKIGTCFVVDATLAEEQCMSSRVTFGVTRSGAIAGTHKSGAGGLSPAALMEMTRAAKRIGLERITKLDVALGSAGKPKAAGAGGAAAAADAGDSKGMEDDE